MKFVDEAKIKVQAGHGGDGIISFRREYRVDRGGPDGGDGGDGGSIFFEGNSGLNTLFSLKYKKNVFGNDGTNGKRKNMYGAKGEDIIIQVPIGTVVYNGDHLLVDVTKPQKYLIAKGGKGGRGNTKFKTSKNTAPRLSERGIPGEAFNLKLILKILANVGLVGKPCAGKSTLLSKISNAKPKIASYDFTTLNPQLGIVAVGDEESLVVADLPGLIKGAALGKGLGYTFLKHIERCKVIAHIIDFGDASKDPVNDYETINAELKAYSAKLIQRKQVIIANKMDQSEIFQYNAIKFQRKYPKLDFIMISALQEKGLKNLKSKLWEAYFAIKDEVPSTKKKIQFITMEAKEEITIENPFYGMFEIKGDKIRKIYNLIPLTSWENFQRFNSLLKREGVWKMLEEKGVKEGDTIRIFNYEFQWQPKDY